MKIVLSTLNPTKKKLILKNAFYLEKQVGGILPLNFQLVGWPFLSFFFKKKKNLLDGRY